MTRRQAIDVVNTLYEQPNPGPVGAYVAGMLARKAGRRHLAEQWLAQALTGNGDTCRAAREYVAALRASNDPDLSQALASLAGHNSGCRLQ